MGGGGWRCLRGRACMRGFVGVYMRACLYFYVRERGVCVCIWLAHAYVHVNMYIHKTKLNLQWSIKIEKYRFQYLDIQTKCPYIADSLCGNGDKVNMVSKVWSDFGHDCR